MKMIFQDGDVRHAYPDLSLELDKEEETIRSRIDSNRCPLGIDEVKIKVSMALSDKTRKRGKSFSYDVEFFQQGKSSGKEWYEDISFFR